MGLEATCQVDLNGERAEGHAHCGDGELEFRGEFRFRWLWKDISSVSATDGMLTAVKGADRAEFHLGDAAEKWAHAIQNPKSRLDKLGLKAGHRYSIWGETDADFPAECLDRAGGPAGESLDLVFVRIHAVQELPELLRARAAISKDGAVWALWAKGRKELTENHVRDFAKANGLVDVKVASFSQDLSALKLVIPVALRG